MPNIVDPEIVSVWFTTKELALIVPETKSVQVIKRVLLEVLKTRFEEPLKPLDVLKNCRDPVGPAIVTGSSGQPTYAQRNVAICQPTPTEPEKLGPVELLTLDMGMVVRPAITSTDVEPESQSSDIFISYTSLLP